LSLSNVIASTKFSYFKYYLCKREYNLHKITLFRLDMRKILLLMLLLFMVSSLQAYSKKIILSAFSSDANAQRSLEMFKKTRSYAELYKLSKKANFKIYVRESGKYHIVVAEPILSRELGVEAYHIVKKEYKNAYLNAYEVPKQIIEKEAVEVKKVKIIEAPKKVQTLKVEKQVIEESPKEVNTTEIKKELKSSLDRTSIVADNADSIEKSIDFAMDLIDILKYVAIFIVFMVLLYYYRKFKRIYDEY